MELVSRLQSLDCSSVPRFSFDGVDTYARVVNVHDPDTITVVFEFNNQLVKINIRIDGVDAPELHSSVQAEVDACVKGTNALKELIDDKVIRVELGKFDKYGRVLSRLYTIDPIDETGLSCINDYLIQHQYVRSYDGGKKVEWSQAELDAVGEVSTVEIVKQRKQRKRR